MPKRTREALYIRGDNGERKKGGKEYGVMMLTTQARGTEFSAHHTLICLFVFMFSVFPLFFHFFYFCFLKKRNWWLLFPFLNYSIGLNFKLESGSVGGGPTCLVNHDFGALFSSCFFGCSVCKGNQLVEIRGVVWGRLWKESYWVVVFKKKFFCMVMGDVDGNRIFFFFKDDRNRI